MNKCDCNPTLPDCHHETCPATKEEEKYSEDYPYGGSAEPYEILRDDNLTI